MQELKIEIEIDATNGGWFARFFSVGQCYYLHKDKEWRPSGFGWPTCVSWLFPNKAAVERLLCKS